MTFRTKSLTLTVTVLASLMVACNAQNTGISSITSQSAEATATPPDPTPPKPAKVSAVFGYLNKNHLILHKSDGSKTQLRGVKSFKILDQVVITQGQKTGILEVRNLQGELKFSRFYVHSFKAIGNLLVYLKENPYHPDQTDLIGESLNPGNEGNEGTRVFKLPDIVEYALSETQVGALSSQGEFTLISAAGKTIIPAEPNVISFKLANDGVVYLKNNTAAAHPTYHALFSNCLSGYPAGHPVGHLGKALHKVWDAFDVNPQHYHVFNSGFAWINDQGNLIVANASGKTIAGTPDTTGILKPKDSNSYFITNGFLTILTNDEKVKILSLNNLSKPILEMEGIVELSISDRFVMLVDRANVASVFDLTEKPAPGIFIVTKNKQTPRVYTSNQFFAFVNEDGKLLGQDSDGHWMTQEPLEYEKDLQFVY